MYITSSSDTERNLSVELILEDIPGGGVVEKDDFASDATEMQEGSLLGVDANGIYHVIKTAAVVAAASGATTLVVPIGHKFKVGDIVTDTAKTITASAITAIAASGTTHSNLTVTAIGAALAAGAIITVGAATGASGTAFAYSPVGIATNTVDLSKSNTGCGIMVRGRVREAILPHPVDATLKAYLPLVRFV